MENLCKEVFPPHEGYKQFQDLIATKQINFFKIRDYAENIARITYKLAVCRNYSKREVENTIEEIFFNNLGPYTQLKLTRQRLSTYDEAFEYILQLERKVMQLVPTQPTTASNMISKNLYEKKPLHNKKSFSTEDKYCKKHGTCKHATENCRDLRPGNKPDKSYVITETQLELGILEISVGLGINTYSAIIDTGAAASYISEDIIYKEKLTLEKIEEKRSILADGSVMDVNHQTNTHIKILESLNDLYALRAKVLKGNKRTILLGNDFLVENKVIIDYSKMSIEIDGHMLSPSNKKLEERRSNLDLDILDKCNLNLIKDESLINKTPPKDEKDRIIIPIEKELTFISKMHDFLGHPGTSRQYYSTKNYVTLPLYQSKIKANIENCLACQHNKLNHRKYGYVSGNITAAYAYPFEKISYDIYGPINLKDKNINEIVHKIYFLTITDIYSRYLKITILKNLNANELVKNFKKILKESFKIPKELITDRGTQYMSKSFSNLLKEQNIIHKPTTPYNPTGNSISERINPTISQCLRIYINTMSIKNIIQKN